MFFNHWGLKSPVDQLNWTAPILQMIYLRLGTESCLEPSSKWSPTTKFASLFFHSSHQTNVHLEKLCLSQGDHNPEDAVGNSGETEEVRDEGQVCDTAGVLWPPRLAYRRHHSPTLSLRPSRTHSWRVAKLVTLWASSSPMTKRFFPQPGIPEL